MSTRAGGRRRIGIRTVAAPAQPRHRMPPPPPLTRSMHRCPSARTSFNLPRARCTTSAGLRTPTAGCTSWSTGPTRFPGCWPRPPALAPAWACPCPPAPPRRSEWGRRRSAERWFWQGCATNRPVLPWAPPAGHMARVQPPAFPIAVHFTWVHQKKGEPPRQLPAGKHSAGATKRLVFLGSTSRRSRRRRQPAAEEQRRQTATLWALPSPHPPAWSCQC